MKKILFTIAFAMITVLSAFAQEEKKTSVFINGIGNIRLGYAGAVNSSDENLLGGVDFGFNILEFGVRPYESGAISIGADFNLDSFHAADKHYFLTASHKTAIVPSLEVFREIKRSRLENCAFSFPLNFKQTIGGKLDITVGASARLNLDADTYVKYISATEDYNSLYTSGVKTNLFNYDVHMGITYDGFGLYASYSPMNVIQSDFGPQFGFFTVGMIIVNRHD